MKSKKYHDVIVSVEVTKRIYGGTYHAATSAAHAILSAVTAEAERVGEITESEMRVQAGTDYLSEDAL